MAAVQEPVILFVLKGGREIEEVKGPGEVFDRVVNVGRGFGVFTDNQVVELAGGLLLKDGGE
jgi:hypothetical protein